jgi:hypothetical protein
LEEHGAHSNFRKPSDTQLSRKEEIQKGCGKEVLINKSDISKHICGTDHNNNAKYVFYLCPTCQARLDERIRAEQDFLKMIDERIILDRGIFGDIWIDANALKSTIQEKTSG